MINEQSYFDIQVNGYGGIDFNQTDLTLEGLHTACKKLKTDGVNGILATIITADMNVMKSRLQNIVRFRDQDSLIREMIYGLHIEGPFINREIGYRGAHQKDFILEVNIDEMRSLLDSAGGLTKIVTLAPEVDSGDKLTRALTDEGIVVSAGHCNPSLDELKSAVDSGLSMITHLGNGCPQVLHRHENIIQRALSLKNYLSLCFIADGIHIPFYALKNYITTAGIENCIITTDAMAAAGAKPGQYQISNITLEVGEDGIVREPGKDNFAGSSITMKQSFKNLTEKLELTNEDATKLTRLNPLKALGIK